MLSSRSVGWLSRDDVMTSASCAFRNWTPPSSIPSINACGRDDDGHGHESDRDHGRFPLHPAPAATRPSSRRPTFPAESLPSRHRPTNRHA